MGKRFFAIASIVLAAALASACSAATPAATETQEPEPQIEETVAPTLTPSSTPAPDLDYATFLSEAQAAGYGAVETGEANSSLFTGEGHILLINGGEVQVFEYADAAALEQQAEGISADGSQVTGPQGVAMVDWVDMPHFFKKGRLLAVYIGRNEQTLVPLKAIFGERFAGGTVEAWGEATPVPPGDGAGLGGMTYDDLRLSLEAAGATVTEGEEISADLFSIAGKVLVVNGVNIDVWEYPDPGAAAADAATIHAGGSMIGERVVDFFGPPNYYHSGRLLVLYVGTDANILTLLSQFLGKPLTFSS